MATTVQRIKVSNPGSGRKKTAQKPQGRKAKNAGYLAAIGALNPQKQGAAKMAKTKKAPAKKSTSRKPSAKKMNPWMSKAHKPATKRKSSNPDKFRPVEAAKSGAIILSGLIISRQLPQLAMGSSNKDWLGYAMNFGTALLGGVGVAMALGTKAGFEFAAGGAAYTISRIATERLSPVGKYLALSGVGDATAASMGDCRRAGIGIVVNSSFSEPLLRRADGTFLIPPHIQAAIENSRPAPMPMQAAPAGVGRFRR